MIYLKNILKLIAILVTIFFMVSAVSSSKIKIFNSGSYDSLLEMHQGKEFTLIFWSIICMPCIRELKIISKNKIYLSGKFVFVSTDGDDLIMDLKQFIEKLGLQEQEHWVFNHEKVDEIINEVDEHWYGEVPRNYFFDDEHNRIRIRVIK